MVVGATSGAGKSTVVAGICRALARSGRSVAPFKAQNMSNHAAVTADGGEVGRAQAMQAAAAGAPLDRRMNPVLLKPTNGNRSHVVVMGDEIDTAEAAGYGTMADRLRPVVLDALHGLRKQYQWVVAEGAGGAAEINLLERDLVNLPLAKAAGLPAVLVVDIEPGGAFAAAHGTLDLLPSELRDQVIGVIFNRFRGDPALLEPGPTQLQSRTGVPLLGVLPWLGPAGLLGVEDSLDVGGGSMASTGADRPQSDRPVRVAALHLPHLANPSDLDPFATEPDVVVRWVTRPGELSDADLIIIPGTRATVSDLDWLRSQGFDRALHSAAGQSAAIVGLCGGYQMMGVEIDDRVESGVGRVDGLGLLDVVTRFDRPKIVGRSTGTAGAEPVEGYQIRFGRPGPVGDHSDWLVLDGQPEGAIDGSGLIAGTSLHGLFDADGFRAELLARVAERRGRRYLPGPVGFAAALEAQHERLADWVEGHLNIGHLLDAGAGALDPDKAPGW